MSLFMKIKSIVIRKLFATIWKITYFRIRVNRSEIKHIISMITEFNKELLGIKFFETLSGTSIGKSMETLI